MLLEDNQQYGANVGWGPSLFGNFYGGGNSFNPQKGGYHSWGGNVGSIPIEEAVGKLKLVEPGGGLVRTARALGICLGD